MHSQNIHTTEHTPYHTYTHHHSRRLYLLFGASCIPQAHLLTVNGAFDAKMCVKSAVVYKRLRKTFYNLLVSLQCLYSHQTDYRLQNLSIIQYKRDPLVSFRTKERFFSFSRSHHKSWFNIFIPRRSVHDSDCVCVDSFSITAAPMLFLIHCCFYSNSL